MEVLYNDHDNSRYKTTGPYQEASLMKVPLWVMYQLSKQAKIKKLNVGKQWKFREGDEEGYLDLSDVDPKAGEPRVSFDEKRKYPRIDCVIPSHFKIYIPELQWYEGAGTIQNLSRGGVLLKINHPGPEVEQIAINNPILVHFDLGFLHMKISDSDIEGRIAHIEQKIRTTLGIEFAALDPDTRQAISDFVWRYAWEIGKF